MSGKLADIAGLKAWEVEFDASGDAANRDAIVGDPAFDGIENLFVFSHGWNNSASGARDLYIAMFTLLSAQLSPELRAKTAVMGVIWPSLLFPEDGPTDDGSPSPTTQSTGAQLAVVLRPNLPQQATQLERLGELLDGAPQEQAKLEEFHGLAAQLVTTDESGGPGDNGESSLLSASPLQAIDAMARMPGAPGGDTQGDNPFTALWHGARNLLRTLSYYEMKNRAGVIGKNGLGPLLQDMHQGHAGLRMHLMGHSFGARLVAYSLDGLPATAVGASSPVKSLVLVQGAFSHHTFSQQYPGALQGIVDRLDGPYLATFSAHDRAVGLWYPNASLLQQQDDQADSDFQAVWGAVGHDGYQQNGTSKQALDALPATTSFAKGNFYNLDGDQVINRILSWFSGAHSDIRHAEILSAAVRAAGL